MSARSRKRDKENQQEETQDESQSGQRSGGQRRGRQSQQSQAQGTNGEDQQAREVSRRDEPRELEPTETFNPISAARLATLRLARSWRYGGKPYAAMHAYERILAKYGGTPAARAAAEELISMASELEQQGKFYTALNIFSKVEEYCGTEREEFYDPWRSAYVRPRRG